MSETEGSPTNTDLLNSEDLPQQPAKKRGLNPIIARVQKIVNEDKPRTSSQLGYESTVGIYGGKLVNDEQGKLIYDITGLVSKIDRFGDPRLREIDDHVASSENRWQAFSRHGKWFWRHYMPFHSLKTPETKRYRGNMEETLKHIQQLGLEAYYGEHPNGIEIKRPEIYSNGINLQDIYRADEIDSPLLNKIDRFQALRQASGYIRQIHDNYGGIGELVSSDIIFQDHSPDGTIASPVLNLPDIVYNPNKKFGNQEQRATDMMDFMVSMSFEEYRRSQDWDQVKRTIRTIVEGYGPENPNDSVIKWTGILLKRGRLTMEESVFSKIHNAPRLGFAEGETEKLRQTIVEICQTPGTNTTP